jgi:alkylhydroperoxidase family enzyme
MHQLTDIFDPVMVNEAEPLLAPFGVWEQGAGVRLSSATTYNLGFDREAFRVAGEAANSQSVKKPKTTQQDAKQNQDEEQETTMSQGPWTRIRPLQIDEVDDYVASAFKQGELTWGHFPNNLMKVMGHCPSLAITEVPYANAFIFDTDVFNNGRQYAGFLDRPIKELCISRTSLYNRSRYSVTHHTFIGYVLFGNIGRQEAGHQKYLHLHEHSEYGYLYTERETACLDFAEKISRDAHEVTDQDFEKLRRLLDQYNRGLAPKDEMFDFDWRFIAKWKDYSDEQHKALVDSQLVELAWLISHFCLLNRWFTVLQVPDETAQDEADFLGAYEQGVPEDLRRRNEELLDGDF